MQHVSFSFREFTALVRGGASGMGAQVARLFAEAGADVVIVDADQALAVQVASSIGAVAVVGDASDPAFCDAAVAQAVHHTGRLNAVVNAAGIIPRKSEVDTPVTDLPLDVDLQLAPDVNGGGGFYLIWAAARHMRAHGGGAVVNFGSIWGEPGGEGAVQQVTRSLALELAPEGVRFNCVCLGEVDAPMPGAASRATPLNDEQAQEIVDRVVPMGRLALPEEIARVVVLLCSDAANHMTGATVYLDGDNSTK